MKCLCTSSAQALIGAPIWESARYSVSTVLWGREVQRGLPPCFAGSDGSAAPRFHCLGLSEHVSFGASVTVSLWTPRIVTDPTPAWENETV
jgi:hypothetical protein